jgi:rhodanese-related sulfurtransferase
MEEFVPDTLAIDGELKWLPAVSASIRSPSRASLADRLMAPNCRRAIGWRRRHAGLVMMCALALTVVACGGVRDQAEPPTPSASAVIDADLPASRLLAPAEFAAAIDEPTRMTINVHVPYQGDIPGTDLSVPFDQIALRAGELPVDRATPLAIYCRSGPMSESAAVELAGLGYKDVVELQGGMKAWQNSGRPLTQE